MKEIDFPALFDEVMSEYPDTMVTDGPAPFHWVFALDAAINKGDIGPMCALSEQSVDWPKACRPYLAEALNRIKSPKKDPYPTSKTPGRPKGGAGRPRKAKLTDYQRFVVVLTMVSRDQREITGYADCIWELATRFGVSESTIREVWDNRKTYFPKLTF